MKAKCKMNIEAARHLGFRRLMSTLQRSTDLKIIHLKKKSYSHDPFCFNENSNNDIGLGLIG